jgi:hypothetical protein
MPVADAYRFKKDINGAKLEIFDALGHARMKMMPEAPPQWWRPSYVRSTLTFPFAALAAAGPPGLCEFHF